MEENEDMTQDLVAQEESPDEPIEPMESGGTDSKSMGRKYVDFGWGEALSPESSMQITCAHPSRLIVLAGGVGSGKSTIISSMYEILQIGPIQKFLFAGSRTLLGFERISHDSRITSKRTTPITDRTKRTKDFLLLHVAFIEETTRTRSDLLLTDVSGELFDEIRDSTEECIRNPILLRCDHFVMLIDGEKLSNPLMRSKAVNDGVLLLRRLLDAKILHNNSLVNVVLTKMDIVVKAIREQSGLAGFIKEMKKNKFMDSFRARLGDLSIHEIAARPEPKYDSDFELGHGLNPLLCKWINCFPLSRMAKGKVCETFTFKNNRAIDRMKIQDR